MQVAAMAGQRKVVSIIGTTMLFGNDVLDMKQYSQRSPPRWRTKSRAIASIFY
jgi:hypothetical protein